ncbi:hypothetical protein F53441_13260 [Fusarium austroafricanum]|uniref:Uncharacterized protein n=1 Tax=Fusarium austroafricanum TaxID=2364996 RepID=A0A8H4NIL6_9HYPO|nr:hypothetical protein F53441_13260 [Fusarium austroafricanum]
MKAAADKDRELIAEELLGTSGDFSAYFRSYDDLATKDNTIDGPISRTHQDVIFVTEYLKSNSGVTKEQALAHMQASWNTTDNLENVLTLAIQAMLMVDSAAQEWHPAGYALGEYRPIGWLSQERFSSFMERSFPKGSEHIREQVLEAFDERSQLKAWKLQKRLGMSFHPTDNLSEHLTLDTKNNILYLFHHAAYLKAHLAKCRDVPLELKATAEDSFKHGTHPPQLLAETLHSLQGILFPSLDRKSGEVLNSLIRKEGFDSECAQYEGYKIFPEPPEDFNYIYWGRRIAQLHQMVKALPPRNKFEKWFQQKTSERNALLIALVALFISIFVGILSIILSCVQIWIAWMQWKHPVQVT